MKMVFKTECLLCVCVYVCEWCLLCVHVYVCMCVIPAVDRVLKNP